ncbi:methyl-accepting chemotaxis protein [Psychromonas sp.]|nr:methyl-accepting chemotaxis protein [Psychromonas sp.]
MQILNRYSIKSRLIISATLGLVGMLMIASQSLMQINNILLSEKKQQIQYLVEVVHSLTESQYKEFKAGKITEEEAKKRAIATINAMRYDQTNYYWINDKTSTMISHPIKPSLNGQDLSTLKDSNGKNIFPAFIAKVKESPEGGVVDYLWPKPGSENPVDKLSFVKEFTPWGWIIGSGIYIDDVDKTLWMSMKTLIIDFVIITLLILILSTFIAKSIIAPINQTTNALIDLAKGNGDLTQRLPVTGQDEIALLSSSFNQLMIKIHNIIEKVQGSAITLKEASLDLSSQSQQSLTSNEKQNAEIEQIASASGEILNMISEIASSAKTAAGLAESASVDAQKSKNIVNNSVSSVLNLSKEINSASTVITELNNECNAIDSVLSVIKAIAEQTNLLALNAAIEAARAGEQGRGFAVVADEVRTLAGRTQEATLEINEIIEQLQNKAMEAVSVISNSEKIAENTAEQANQASESLDAITSAIMAISDANNYIAKASDEQSHVTKGIDERVAAISEISDESTERSENINRISDKINQLGSQLKELIQTFRI